MLSRPIHRPTSPPAFARHVTPAAAVAFVRQYVAFFSDACSRVGLTSLDFNTFVQALPEEVRRQHTEQEMTSWFQLADKDGDGCEISLVDFVRFSLSMAAMVSGAGMLDIFSSYDRDQSGFLGAKEFESAAADMGFGEHAPELFDELAVMDETGALPPRLDYVQFVRESRPAKGTSRTMREFIKAVDSHVRANLNFDTSGWRFSAHDPPSVRASLRALLGEHGLTLSDLFTQLDTSGNNVLTRAELRSSMIVSLGFHGPREVIDELFDTLDDDGSGSISFTEMNSWYRGRDLSAKQARH